MNWLNSRLNIKDNSIFHRLMRLIIRHPSKRGPPKKAPTYKTFILTLADASDAYIVWDTRNWRVCHATFISRCTSSKSFSGTLKKFLYIIRIYQFRIYRKGRIINHWTGEIWFEHVLNHSVCAVCFWVTFLHFYLFQCFWIL